MHVKTIRSSTTLALSGRFKPPLRASNRSLYSSLTFHSHEKLNYASRNIRYRHTPYTHVLDAHMINHEIENKKGSNVFG